MKSSTLELTPLQFKDLFENDIVLGTMIKPVLYKHSSHGHLSLPIPVIDLAMQYFQVLALALLASCASAQTWDNHDVLDSVTGIELFWNVGNTDITLQLQANTPGWVGLGFSPDGSMTNSDMAIGWVANGVTTFQDYHGVGDTDPVLDAVQNYNLVNGVENSTTTVLEFSRLLNTGDTDDYVITSGPINVIWAWFDEDPADPNSIPFHGDNHGSKLITLLPANYRRFSPRFIKHAPNQI